MNQWSISYVMHSDLQRCWRDMGWSHGKVNYILCGSIHDYVIKWKHFPHYWPFVWGIHRWPVTSPHRWQWRGAFMFSLICNWTNGWVNNWDAGDLRWYHAHYVINVMCGQITLHHSKIMLQQRVAEKSWWRHQMETFSPLLAISAGNHRSPVNSPHKGQRRGALMFLWSAPE